MWFEFENKDPSRAGQLRTKLTKVIAPANVVVASGLVTIALVRDDHGAKWAENVATEYTCTSVKPVAEPTHHIMLCGLSGLTADTVKRHESHCSSCKALRRNGPSPTPTVVASPAETVVSVKGLADLSLNGMLSLMRQRVDEAMGLAATYEAAITAIERMGEAEKQLAAAQALVDSDRKALAYFLGEEKSS